MFRFFCYNIIAAVMPLRRSRLALKCERLCFNVLSGVKIFDFANAVRLLYRNRGALRGRGGSMNPSARQRRYHDRGIHYTMITGQWRFDVLRSLAISCNHYIIIS